ncbi:MAG: sigma-70 family RNA polymerase sigma factor [Ruminococcaceae bacterium]|nr:sigma-70 family RNA polymerase sigma factor [Oscillospiraceae bacterium]
MLLFSSVKRQEFEEKDMEFIKELYIKNYDSIVRFCSRKTKTIDDARDIAQEVFLIFIDKINEIDKTKARAWLYGTANNKLSEYMKSPDFKLTQISEEIESKLKSISLEEEYFNCSEKEILYKKDIILNCLSDEKRKFYEDYYIRKLSHKEIAEKNGISVQASKVRKNRLMLELVKIINSVGTDL